MESDSVASAMIRRFRDAKPTSRTERDSAKTSGRIREMWWVDEDANADKGGGDSRGGGGGSGSGGSGSGSGGYGHRQPAYPGPGRSSYDINNNASMDRTEQPRPSPHRPSEKPPLRTTNPAANSIDDIIMKDVLGLNESMDWDNRRKTLFGEDSDRSIDGPRKSAAPTSYRYEHGGREDYSKFRKSGEALLNESLDTIGSLGFHGLSVPNLKLDGAKDPTVARTGASAGQINEVNANLEELLKTLGAGKENLTREGLPESIMQVYNDVNSDLLTFKSKFEAKYDKEDAEAKLRAERDEQMKNMGREEERGVLLQQMSKMDKENELYRRNQADFLDSSYSGSESDYILSSVERQAGGGMPPTAPAPAPVEDQVHDLRSALQTRMRQLEQMHADAMKETVFNDPNMAALGPAPVSASTSVPVSTAEAPLGADAAAADAAISASKTHASPKSSLLYGQMKEPFLDSYGPHQKGHAHRHRSHGEGRSYSGADKYGNGNETRPRSRDASRERGREHRRRPERGREERSAAPEEPYTRPDSAGTALHAPLHSSLVSAAKYITLSLNVAMEGLHQRLPEQTQSQAQRQRQGLSPASQVSDGAQVPSYAEVTGDYSGPRVPTHPAASPAPGQTRLPSYQEATGAPPCYEEAVGSPSVPSEIHFPPPLPSPKYIPPLTAAEKMTIDIDRALGPVGSSLEDAELAWWRRGDQGGGRRGEQPPRQGQGPGQGGYAPTVSSNNASSKYMSGEEHSREYGAAARSWLGHGSPGRRVASVSRPSAPVFPLPRPPPMPLSRGGSPSPSQTASPQRAGDDGEKSFPSYLSNSRPINYNRATEGMALNSVRSNHSSPKQEVVAQPPFSPGHKSPESYSSPNSITVDASMTEREMYLKKMQHYRTTLSGAVL
jgi:hypothetical protein